MLTFIVAGLVYLLGVGIVLVIRPAMMFSPDGNWKEFGIGKREDRYTPFPFWLFCIVWALASYFMVIALMAIIMPESSAEFPNSNSRRNVNSRAPISMPEMEEAAQTLPKGYYVLNKKATKLSGVPKYVYLGEEEPNS
jgi:hypothetical protein